MADKISQQDLNRMAVRGAKVKRRASAVPTEEEVAAVAPKPAPPPQPQDMSVPFASMQASMNAINSQLGAVVENNTMAIEQFRQDLAQQKPRAGIAYRHRVVRDRSSKLIDYVDSYPLTGES